MQDVNFKVIYTTKHTVKNNLKKNPIFTFYKETTVGLSAEIILQILNTALIYQKIYVFRLFINLCLELQRVELISIN